MGTKQVLLLILISMMAFIIVGAIEGRAIKNCVELGNTLEKCKRVNGVN